MSIHFFKIPQPAHVARRNADGKVTVISKRKSDIQIQPLMTKAARKLRRMLRGEKRHLMIEGLCTKYETRT